MRPVLLLSALVVACGTAEAPEEAVGASEAAGADEAGAGAAGGEDGGAEDSTGEGDELIPVEGESELPTEGEAEAPTEGEAEVPGDGGDEGDAGGDDAGDGGAEAGPTWHRDVKPILDERCGGCHVQGGVAPFGYETLELARIHLPSGIAAIREGRMPPWLPTQDCKRYRDERLIPEQEIEVLEDWVGNGSPEGLPTDAPPPQGAGVDAGPPDLILKPLERYVPREDRPDDYRCFALDLHFEDETFVVKSQVIPGRVELVHHVLLYRVPADAAGELADLDAADPGPGYTCYGGPRVGGGGPIGAWVPGSQPAVADPGTAVVMPPGTRVVMQVHYNLLAAETAPDMTEWHVWTTAEVPQFNLRAIPQPNLDIRIPAGDPTSVHVREFPNRLGVPLTVVAVAPHMHVLGTKIRVDHLRADGSQECLIDIPDWDFNWQQSYLFRPGQALTIGADESIRLTCEYDNSAANQPVVNGERLEPRDVRWGEGTLDEMCLNYITVLEPFVAGGGGDCAQFPACTATCDDPASFGCWMECMTGNLGCAQCAIERMVGNGGCLRSSCPLEGLAVQECFTSCLIEGATGGSILACAEENCPAGWAALAACMDPVVAAGQCDNSVASCGATMD